MAQGVLDQYGRRNVTKRSIFPRRRAAGCGGRRNCVAGCRRGQGLRAGFPERVLAAPRAPRRADRDVPEALDKESGTGRQVAGGARPARRPAGKRRGSSGWHGRPFRHLKRGLTTQAGEISPEGENARPRVQAIAEPGKCAGICVRGGTAPNSPWLLTAEFPLVDGGAR